MARSSSSVRHNLRYFATTGTIHEGGGIGHDGERLAMPPLRIPNGPERLWPADCLPRMSSNQLASSKQRSREERKMRLFTRSLAATILTAGCYVSLPAVNVQAQSPSP